MASVTCIQFPEDPLPSCNPHLMPFHIGYSGPAPISTYFRVKGVPPPPYGLAPKKEETQPEPMETQGVESQFFSESQETVIDETPPIVDTPSNLAASSGSSTATLVNDEGVGEGDSLTTSASRHFLSAFRGRTIHGLRVDLPEGYSGIILRPPNSSAGNSRPNERYMTAANRGKSARRSRGTTATEGDDGDEEQTEEPPEDIRILKPSATFSSFVLWHPDIPVDEGKDEYLRSLTEWTKLAVEIHRYDE